MYRTGNMKKTSKSLWDEFDEDEDDVFISFRNNASSKEKNLSIENDTIKSNLFELDDHIDTTISKTSDHDDFYDIEVINSEIDYKKLYENEKFKCDVLQSQLDSLIKQLLSLNVIPNITKSLPEIEINNAVIFDRDKKLRTRARKVHHRIKTNLISHNDTNSKFENINININENSDKSNLFNDTCDDERDNNIDSIEMKSHNSPTLQDQEWERLANEEKQRKAKLRLHKQNMIKKERISLRRTMTTDKTAVDKQSSQKHEILNESSFDTNNNIVWTDSDEDQSDWDKDSNEIISNNIQNQNDESYAECRTILLESQIENNILAWARSRRDIIDMFQTVNQAYHGILPDLGENWKRNIVTIHDYQEIRKAYMKLVRVCHPDKHSHLNENDILRVQANKVFTALTDSYNHYKSKVENVL